MNTREYFERVADLERAHASFALATVVVRRAPVSSHLGDRAIVFADGRMEGFVGGSCSRDIVRRQALDAIRTGHARLLQIRPDATERSESEEIIVVPMGCASEGAVDVYIEPHLPARTLLVAGYTPVADALVRLAGALDTFRAVRVVADEELRDLVEPDSVELVALGDLPEYLKVLETSELRRLAAVVASQGHYDEAALEALLKADEPAFIGLLASRKRASAVIGILEQQGVDRERLSRVHHPVGLDLGARAPGEVAVSILAEIIAATSSEPPKTEPETPVETAVDPVCDMDVEVALAAHHAEYGGRTYYFCGAHCRAAFLADPEPYVAALHQP